jgi:hypothetical protein
VARLTEQEQAELDRLTQKQQAPDDPGGRGGNVDVYIDLSDEHAVRRGLRLGLLDRNDLDEFDPDPEPEPDPEPAPRRRKGLGDRWADDPDGDGGGGGKGAA